MIATLCLLVGFVAVIWIVEIANILMGHGLSAYGIVPRTQEGLRGIPLSPFLHAGIGHVLSNTVPLLALGGFTALRARGAFPWISLAIIIVGGAGVWVIGRSAVHVGASGLVFGYFGYLVAKGWYDKSILSVLVAVIVIVVFGWGMLSGILPVGGFISWEGHLCGLLTGVLVAWITRARGNRSQSN
jgi:membrane associated rhomboid family serine protease